MKTKSVIPILIFIAISGNTFSQENNSEKKHRWQLNLLYGLSNGNNISAWSGLETYKEGYDNKSGCPTITLSYKLNNKSRIQLSYNYTLRNSAALIFAGSAYSTSGGYDIFGFSEILNLFFGSSNSGTSTVNPPQTNYSNYYNSIVLESFVDYISLTYEYNLTEKLKLFKMPVAIHINGGPAFTGVTENVTVSGYQIENEKLLNNGGAGFRYDYKPGIAASGGIQVAIHLSRTIVLIPFDFVQRLALVKPTVPTSETKISNYSNYSLAAPAHKINTTGNSLSFGLGIIF